MSSMAASVRVYVFGDQTYDIGDSLSRLIHYRGDPVLSDFLERCCRRLQREVARLEPDQQIECPPFSKLANLVLLWRAGTLNPALCQALTCICQLGTIILEHGCEGTAFPKDHDACLTGLCTGALSAAAVSCSTSSSDILSLGVYTVAVAFRVGACAWDVGSRLAVLKDTSDKYQSWTAALSNVDKDEVDSALENFSDEKGLAKTASPYVSAQIASSQVSVSAAPDILNALLSETYLAKHVVSRIPISAPYHAKHLYCLEDVDSLLSDLTTELLAAPRSDCFIPIISSVTGRPIAANSFSDLLRTVVQDCLCSSIRWDLTASGVATLIKSRLGVGTYNVHPIATTFDSLLRSAIQKCISQASETSVDPKLFKPVDRHHSLRNDVNAPASKSKIAIVGMSGRFPRAGNMDAFWDVLAEGIDTYEVVPPTRWNSQTHVDPTSSAKNVSGTGFGCWLHDAAKFDARFFNMSPREAPQVDPAQRMALLTAAEALEQAGVVPGRTASTQKSRVGVYFGSTSNDWMETNSAQDIDTYFIPGGNRAFIPGRINYHFKFSGPSYTIDTACSSSLAALHMACNALWRGEVDTAIVGGTNVLTNPDMTAGLDRGHFLSRTGNCKTFDDSADGYCRGEAVATAVLKRLDDAILDKDTIQACILAIATNHSAEADSITRPHVGAQQALFDDVLADAGVDATSISYVEMHGTGTQAGDAGETASVLGSLAPIGKSMRKPHQPLYIGAAKANVGHGESAAGVTSLAKVLLMMKKSMIPPHCGIKSNSKINTKLPDLQSRNTFIARNLVSWPRPKNSVRQVLLNNFSAAGGNTAVVLEDGPEIPGLAEADPRKHHVVAVSAKTPASLEHNIQNMIDWIENQLSDTLLLPQLSYTTTARRMHHLHRIMVAGSDLTQIKTSLQQSLARKDGANRSKCAPSYVFSFTGQGCQFLGMGADLYTHFSGFRADIHRYDRLCSHLDLPTIRQLFEVPSTYNEATPTMLQLAGVSLQMALFRLWISLGVSPKVVVGHSLGEYAALYAAGVLSQADVLGLVGQRAQLMEQHCEKGSHAMLAVRSSASGLADLIGPPGEDYEISCINGRQSLVLGGTKNQINRARPTLTKRGLSNTILEVPYAFHTSQVDPILSSLSSMARGINFATPKIPIISPTLGKVVRNSSDFQSDFVLRHCRASVNMLDALNLAKEEGVINEKMMGIEIGPAPVVIKMVKEVAGSGFQTFASVRQGEDTWKLMSQALSQFYAAGAIIDWTTYHKDFASCQRCIELPRYSWDMKDYWIQYVHDWSLRKGDPPLLVAPAKLESSSIHKILEDSLSSSGGQLVLESDLTRPDLYPMVQGHKVYGVPLCTPSVYADIALTVGQYVKQILRPNEDKISVDVSEMNIQSALVVNSDGQSQVLRTTVRLDQQTMIASCTFSSVYQNGKATEQHSNCLLRLFDTRAYQQELQDSAPTIKSDMEALKARIGSIGNTFRYSKSMIYKMVGQLADFDPNYRGLVEIALDSDALEATGRVDLRPVLREGKFHTNPAYIDALSQLGGFVMNANETVDLDKEVFVNHGWHSLRLFEQINADTVYTSHVKMKEDKDKLWTGDITVFDGEKIVAVFSGVALQGVPKRLMQYVVSAAEKRISSKPQSVEKAEKPTNKVTIPPQSVIAPVQAVSKTTTKTSTVSSQPTESSLVAPAMRIISEESGVALDDLTDEARFDDFGVDSFLALMVSSRLRDELDIDLDSSVFFELSTVAKFKTYLRGMSGDRQSTVVTETIKEEIMPDIFPITANDTAADDTWEQILAVISEESGIVKSDLADDTIFSDIGIDSLLSLVICSRLREEYDLDLPDRSLFQDFITVGSLKNRITTASQFSDKQNPANDSDSSDPSSPDSSCSSDKNGAGTPDSGIGSPTRHDSMNLNEEQPEQMIKSFSVNDTPIKPAWSIVLQGSPRRMKEKLFLFPDGCGAATSYLKIPLISDSTAVVGFNSPFMKTPHVMFGRPLPEVLGSYIEALRRHQSNGPYHLGGWSAGGILAYAVAQELIASGDEIATLTLIDSPAPTNGLDRLPRRFFDHCSSVGIFGSELLGATGTNGINSPSKMPEWLMPHFEATIELLHDYRAPPMKRRSDGPKVTIIWAGTCAFDGDRYATLPPSTADDEDTEGMKFLTERRTDFGPGKWDDLFPGHDINVHVVEGEHHFSMMRGEGAEHLAGFVRKSLGHRI